MSWEHSRTATVLQAVAKRAVRATKTSVLAKKTESLATRVESIVRNSYCYRWLTAEPDPEVIVIDLRETYMVGPFLRLLERIIHPMERAWVDSELASVTETVGAVLTNSRTGQVLAALLEPPEPPENEN